MSEDKPWYTKVPAISVALVAFLVTVTTLINNVREIGGLKNKPVAAVAAPAEPAGKPAAAPSTAAPSTLAEPKPQAPARFTAVLTLEKIEVVNDGTSGSTAWSFDVSAGGAELFALPSRDYNDAEDQRIAQPRPTDPSMGRVTLVPGQEMLIKISGRSSGLISKANATGTATLQADRPLEPVRVAANDGRDGEFLFHFGVVVTAE